MERAESPDDHFTLQSWRLARQLDNVVPDTPAETRISPSAWSQAIARTNHALDPLLNRNGRPVDPLVSWEYAMLLYYLSRAIADEGDHRLAARLFSLNKALNGIDLFYEVDMPDRFLIGHTVGMVFAKADYGEYCVFHQGCTVGRILQEKPILESRVVMYPGSSIIGRCHVRDNTVLSAGVQLINCDTPGNCIVFSGERGRPVFKPITEVFAERYYAAT